MKPLRSKPPPPKKTPGKRRNGTKDPVKVFCRLRPMQHENDVSCMRVLSPTTLCLSMPETGANHRTVNVKEIQCMFKHVFDESASQKEVFDIVALPLVKNLIHGKNGLLFTYGVTGSGKTFTMTGDPKNGGIMPRCLDVIFNSIAKFQANKFVFKPDKMNGFDIQSETDALMDRQSQTYSVKALKTPLRKNLSDPDLTQRARDESRVDDVDEDNTYAVFVTYVEIYNNGVYDLLEEIPEDTIKARQLQVKIIREDANRNMYVHSVTEMEVKTTEEAFEAFYKGQKRKRMAITTLNSESSRSHSVFTIRLVQAPLDCYGENAMQDRKSMCVSQLSLVDLAGSERTNRTKNSGQRLREAGSINNSLMTLRTCLEILRENQMQGANKMVPYRDSKLTHFFKNYFDGEGQVEMIVCVNPRVDDYDETVHVMKFAELTQEVQILQPPAPKLDFGLTPGRRKANQSLTEDGRKNILPTTNSSLHVQITLSEIQRPYHQIGNMFRQALATRLEENDNKTVSGTETDVVPVYCLGPPFPPFEISDPYQDQIINGLISYLDLRMRKRNALLQDFKQRWNDFRSKVIAAQTENDLKSEDCKILKATVDQGRIKVAALESRLMNTEAEMMSLQHRLEQKHAGTAALKRELENEKVLLSQQMLEKERLRQKYSNMIAAHKEKNTLETQKRLKEQEEDFFLQMKDQEEKLRKMKHILDRKTPLTARTPVQATKSVTNLNLYQTPGASESNNNMISQGFSSHSSKRGLAVSNPRHRRSRSAGDELWLDHRPAMPVELGTVLQPTMKKRKSITKLTDAKDVTDPKTSKYCLMTQEQDSAGEVETRLYKADVVPTTGGGAQVIFNDVETLKQHSPTSSPPRKRTASTDDLRDVEAACSVALEGHKRAKY